MTYKREATWSKELRHRYADPEATVIKAPKSEPTEIARVAATELIPGDGRPQMSIWATIKNEVLLFWKCWGLGIRS
jgi:hypothetical protein